MKSNYVRPLFHKILWNKVGDLPIEILETLPVYYNPPKNCPLDIHQSILRKLYHCNRVIKKADFSINFK